GGLAGEGAGHVTIAGAIHGDGQAIIIEAAAAGGVGPEDVACAVILGDEDVVATAADQSGVAESGHIVESAGHVSIARWVHRDAPAEIIEAAARRSYPAEGRRLGVGGRGKSKTEGKAQTGQNRHQWSVRPVWGRRCSFLH